MSNDRAMVSIELLDTSFDDAAARSYSGFVLAAWSEEAGGSDGMLRITPNGDEKMANFAVALPKGTCTEQGACATVVGKPYFRLNDTELEIGKSVRVTPVGTDSRTGSTFLRALQKFNRLSRRIRFGSVRSGATTQPRSCTHCVAE